MRLPEHVAKQILSDHQARPRHRGELPGSPPSWSPASPITIARYCVASSRACASVLPRRATVIRLALAWLTAQPRPVKLRSARRPSSTRAHTVT